MTTAALSLASLATCVPTPDLLTTGLESCGLATADTAAVLSRLAAGKSTNDLSSEIAAGTFLSKRSRKGREHLMAAIRRRYLTPRPPLSEARVLAAGLGVVVAPLARNQLLLPYLLSSDRGSYEVMAGWAAARRAPGARITTADVMDQLDDVFARHGRRPWGPSLRLRWAQGVLSVLRDVGAVGRGRQREQYLAYSVRAEALSFHLWSLYEDGIRGSALIRSGFWRLLLLSDEEETRQAVRLACERGWWRLTAVGGVEELRPTAKSMSEWLAHALG